MNTNTFRDYYNKKAKEVDEYHLTYGNRNILKRGFYNARFKHVFNALSPQKNEKILDIGCGIGYYAEQIAKVDAKVYGTDISKNYIKEAKKRTGNTVIYRVVDAINLPFNNNYFDKVLMTEVIEHIPEYTKALQEAHRVLKMNGQLIITTPNKYSYMNYAYNIKRRVKRYSFNEHLHEFTKKMMQKSLEKHFLIQNIYFSNYLIPYPFDQLFSNTSSRKIVKIILELDLFLEKIPVIKLFGWTMIFICKKK